MMIVLPLVQWLEYQLKGIVPFHAHQIEQAADSERGFIGFWCGVECYVSKEAETV